MGDRGQRGIHAPIGPASRRSTLGLGRRASYALAAIVIACTASGCSWLDQKQRELIFRPAKESWWGSRGVANNYEERWIPVGTQGEKIHAWWAPSTDAHAPALLYLHGARWDLSASVSRIERWKKLGFSVLAIDYRGFGKSTDVTPSEEFAYEDAEAAWTALAAIAPGKPRFLVGHSLGGAVAAEMARRHPEASGLVLEATFTSIKDMVAQSTWSVLPVGLILTQQFDTLAKMPDIHVPVMVTHGTSDSVVPFEMGEKLFAAAQSPKRFVKVDGGSHHNLSAAGFDAYRTTLHELFAM
jgi:alpha-beta hydrolase superfamily lysophospholipase